MEYQIESCQERGRHAAVSTFEALPAQIGEKIGRAYGTVFESLQRRGIAMSGPALAFYEMRPGAEPPSFRVSAGFFVPEPVPPEGDVRPLQLPRTDVLVTMHIGPYSELPKAYEAVQAEATRRGARLDERYMWEEYLTPPETPPAEHTTVICWPYTR